MMMDYVSDKERVHVGRTSVSTDDIWDDQIHLKNKAIPVLAQDLRNAIRPIISKGSGRENKMSQQGHSAGQVFANREQSKQSRHGSSNERQVPSSSSIWSQRGQHINNSHSASYRSSQINGGHTHSSFVPKDSGERKMKQMVGVLMKKLFNI